MTAMNWFAVPFRAEARGYLLKVDPEKELLQALQEVVSGGAYISPKIDRDVVNSVLSEIQRD